MPAPSQRSLAKLRGCLTLPRNSRSSRPDWVGSACVPPRAPKKLRTGRRGPTYFLSSIPGHPLSQEFVTQLEHGPAAAAACLQQADQAGRHLDLHGWAHRPPWTSLLGDAAPPPPLADREPAWWRHGWQHPASVAVTTYHRQERVLPSLSPTDRALLRSQAGPGAGAWLLAVPSDPGTTLPPPAMNIALRRRLRLPLPVTAATCGVDGRGHGCGGPLDPYGDHALACPRSGALARRAPVVERAWVRVAREAIGADGRVVPQQWVASLNLPGVSSTDRRRLDLVIYGATPLGEALCCDATLVSALTRGGAPIPRAADTDAVLRSWFFCKELT